MTEEQTAALEALRDAIQDCENLFGGVWVETLKGCVINFTRVTGAIVDKEGDIILGDF